MHEAVQPAMCLNDLRPGTQQQVQRIAEDDLRPETLELLGRHGLHRPVGTDRHERRRVDGAVGRDQAAEARSAIGRKHAEGGIHAALRVRSIASP